MQALGSALRSQARYLELNCRSSTQTCTPHKKGQPSKQHAAMGVQVAPVAVAEATDIETGQGVPPACPFKEATLELRDSRILELRSMMHRGAEYAQAAVLRAGYFGGESRLAIAGWSFAGCLLVLYSIQLLYSALRGGSDYAWAMKTRGYVAALCLAAITSLVLGVAVLRAGPEQLVAPRGVGVVGSASLRGVDGGPALVLVVVVVVRRGFFPAPRGLFRALALLLFLFARLPFALALLFFALLAPVVVGRRRRRRVLHLGAR